MTEMRRFLRHLFEMIVAMVLGMMVLGPVWTLAFAGLGWSDLLDRPDLGALVMATNMTVGMSAWMRVRSHTWAGVWEMAIAMFLPFVVLLVPYWTGLLSGEALLVAGHVLMLPCMIVAMLRHRRPRRRVAA